MRLSHAHQSNSRKLRINSAVQIAKILKAPFSRHPAPASHAYSAATRVELFLRKEPHFTRDL
nr:hypothetical protein [Bradyrhizobium sp. 1(2017)]QIO35853.1 hypothetical protein HAP40_30580 [Bradyrhizobium sp. 1(2017)]